MKSKLIYYLIITWAAGQLERQRKALVLFVIFCITLSVVLQVDFKCDVVLDTEPVTPKVVS